MTKQSKRALKLVGVPAVAIHQSGQYFCRIGYRKSSSGKRQRAFFYLGREERAAVAKAAALKHEWKEIKRRDGERAVWPTTPRVQDKQTADSIAPDARTRKLSLRKIKAAIAEYEAAATADAMEDADTEIEVATKSNLNDPRVTIVGGDIP